MNIGFDAKRLFYNTTGLGNYSRALVKGLCEYYPDNTYVLFTPKQIEREQTRFFTQSCKIVSAPRKFFKKTWRSKGMVADIRKQNISIYHGLSHELPIGISHTQAKSIVTIHDFAYKLFPQDFPLIDRITYDIKWKYACTHADAIIATSEATKKDIIHYFNIPESKIHVVYQSCDPIFSIMLQQDEKKQVLERYMLPDSFILYVGSLTARKNVLSLLQAYHSIANTTTTPLVICGNGGVYKQKIVQYIQDNKLDTKVFIRTAVETADLPALYQSARVFIYPSSYEGFGIPVLEALTSNCRVITSNCSCLPEVGGDAALYCSPDSTRSIAEAIQAAIHEKTIPEDVQEKIKNHAKRFSQQQFIEKTMSIYCSIV